MCVCTYVYICIHISVCVQVLFCFLHHCLAWDSTKKSYWQDAWIQEPRLSGFTFNLQNVLVALSTTFTGPEPLLDF